jgi:hypothetical protein
MIIDLTQTFVNADDSPAIDAETKAPISLKSILIQACLTEAGQNGQPIANDEKVKRYDLYRTIKKADGTVKLTAEDVALLKRAAGVFPILVMGQIHEMLEKEAS